MVVRARTIKKLRDLGYTVDAHDSIVFISKLVNGIEFKIYIYPYDLFKTHIVDDVERKINNLVIEHNL